jgi:transposase
MTDDKARFCRVDKRKRHPPLTAVVSDDAIAYPTYEKGLSAIPNAPDGAFLHMGFCRREQFWCCWRGRAGFQLA